MLKFFFFKLEKQYKKFSLGEHFLHRKSQSLRQICCRKNFSKSEKTNTKFAVQKNFVKSQAQKFDVGENFPSWKRHVCRI